MQQLTLPLETTVRNGMKDPASNDNRNHPVHRWVPWIAGFSGEFVKDVIQTHLQVVDESTLVLDPFSGVGTTLVESLKAGIPSIGFEINPYAVLACRVKAEIPHYDAASLEETIVRYKGWMRRYEQARSEPKAGDILDFTVPQGFRSRIPFFSERVLWQVLATLDFIHKIDDPKTRDFFLVAFGSVMVRFSNYSYEPSLGTRPGSGKPLIADAPVCEIISLKLGEMVSDVLLMQAGWDGGNAPSMAIVHDSFFNAEDHLDRNTVDLVVTSPPYLNNYHYVRNTRPQLWWLNLVNHTSALKDLENMNVGKFWQTVRDSDEIPLEVDIPSLQGLVGEIRNTNTNKGSYGGPGWANYVSAYFNDTDRFLRIISSVLKHGGRAIIVVGNSIIQGVDIPVDGLIAEIGAHHGLDTETIEVLRSKRVGSSIVNSTVRTQSQGARIPLYESAVVLRKS